MTNEERDAKLEQAKTMLCRIFNQDLIDEEDVDNLKQIAAWALTELRHMSCMLHEIDKGNP